ncbi:hypothetical protein KFD70_28480 [Bacillus pfraonensis]|uniref:hypothetical protein n=1 Tax=Bacillus TaxID=1386 RepID=UPI003012D458
MDKKEKEQRNTTIKDVISISATKKYIWNEFGYKPIYIDITEKVDREVTELMGNLFLASKEEKKLRH